MNRRTFQILTIVFLVGLTSSLIIPVYSEAIINKQIQDLSSVSTGSSELRKEFPIELTKNEFQFNLPYRQSYPGYESNLVENLSGARKPEAQILEVRLKNSDLLDPDLGDSQTITLPTPSSQYIRGVTITVTGVLTSGLPGDFWDGETVYLYYNITKATFEGNKLFYEGNPQYEVGSAITNSLGVFSIDLVTSDLSIDPFSKVGEITLLTWFRGSLTDPNRLEGSPGDVIVEIYGELEFSINPVVGNPNFPYSFTTQILFDNGTVLDPTGTSFDYVVDWATYDAFDDSGTAVFASNQHIYSGIAPAAGTDSVTYDVDYDITQLPFSFFVRIGTFNPALHLLGSAFGNTEESALVDAYYNIGSALSKIPMEIEIGDTFEIQANLSSSSGLESAKTINVYYYYDGSNHTSPSDIYTTNSTGGIKFSTYLNPLVNVSDITQGFIVYLQPVAAEFPGARMIGDSLDSVLTVNITTVRITIADIISSYTVGLPIDFTVEIEDINGNLCPISQFQIDFTGEPPDFYFTTASGDRDIISLVPSYAVQAQTEPITVTGLDYDGGTYKYYAPSSPTAADNFNMYYALSLTLTDNDGGAALDGTSRDVWNRTFWNDFDINDEYYELQAQDQWGGNPVGARISITFAGEEAFFFVTAGQNYVRYDKTHLGAGWDHNLAFTGDLIAIGGDYAPATTITQTINIYGPDTEAPVLVSVNLSPDPNSTASHDPYFNITFTVVATDADSGVRSVIIYYDLYDELGVYDSTSSVTLTNIAPDTYEDNITMNASQSQWYVEYSVEVKDYAGHGLDEFGSRQILPAQWYDANFGYTDTEDGLYRVGDFHPPEAVAVPVVTYSGNIPNPFIDISVFVNDSKVYSGMWFVAINVTGRNLLTNVVDVNFQDLMINVPFTNEWTYHIDLDYNYNYTWYYGAYDNALPQPNLGLFPSMFFITDDSDSPNIFAITVNAINGTADPDSVLTFNASVIDILTNVSTVTINITISLGTTIVVEDYSVEMTRIGTSDIFTATVDLSQFRFRTSGTYALLYTIAATDAVENTGSVLRSLSVVYESSGLGIGNLGAIIGGAAGAVVLILAGLFLWFNRHTIKTYAQKQTFRRRLRDYLREIIDDIKKDGLEGRYKQGLLKTWSVVEGIGREFYDLPRYRSQTPTEFARLLAYKSKIERELIGTLLEYFEKARYGFEEITEKDFNAGVRALLKIVDKIEVGEMKIES
ncbi:MAG: DUF4129 domain-containing protein [Candidatus Heimdallarchaeota archaeon]|nr:DUF4129 domain-containing protein [Candidatus Heimdallarchaeota archaeon]